jgi:hypothetical protein
MSSAKYLRRVSLSWGIGTNGRGPGEHWCTAVGEGEGIGEDWDGIDGISNAIAFTLYEGDSIINLDDALDEHARRSGWSLRGNSVRYREHVVTTDGRDPPGTCVFCGLPMTDTSPCHFQVIDPRVVTTG